MHISIATCSSIWTDLRIYMNTYKVFLLQFFISKMWCQSSSLPACEPAHANANMVPPAFKYVCKQIAGSTLKTINACINEKEKIHGVHTRWIDFGIEVCFRIVASNRVFQVFFEQSLAEQISRSLPGRPCRCCIESSSM